MNSEISDTPPQGIASLAISCSCGFLLSMLVDDDPIWDYGLEKITGKKDQAVVLTLSAPTG